MRRQRVSCLLNCEEYLQDKLIRCWAIVIAQLVAHKYEYIRLLFLKFTIIHPFMYFQNISPMFCTICVAKIANDRILIKCCSGLEHVKELPGCYDTLLRTIAGRLPGTR